MTISLKERFEMIWRGEAPQPPVAKLIGFNIASIEPGEAVIAFEATKRHANPGGILHGGILCDIADAAMATAYSTTLERDEAFTTLELKINFLKVIQEGKLRAIGRVLSAGKKIGLLECEILNNNDELVAKASSTCLVSKQV
ncbi:MAG: PaaI family thioesterase [Chloroflexota bacterium]|nr:PaaI family thioesterase [Chloroflexota bacterium]